MLCIMWSVDIPNFTTLRHSGNLTCPSDDAVVFQVSKFLLLGAYRNLDTRVGHRIISGGEAPNDRDE
jgi:hypothetical protein